MIKKLPNTKKSKTVEEFTLSEIKKRNGIYHPLDNKNNVDKETYIIVENNVLLFYSCPDFETLKVSIWRDNTFVEADPLTLKFSN